MFRTMRRSPQALSHEEMIDLLKTETRGVMSVQGDDGYPYGYPINHYYDEETNKIYIHGATFGHRVSAVKKDPKVSYCVFGGEYQKLCDKFPCPPEYVEHEIEKDAPRTLVIAINIENMNGKLVHEA